MLFYRLCTTRPLAGREAFASSPGRHLSPAWLTLAAAALVLSGCVTPEGAGIPPSVDRAESLVRSGDQAGAGRVYEELARQNTGTHRGDLAILAARAYIAAHQSDDAARALTLVPEPVTPEQNRQRALVLVDMDLAHGVPQQAWQRINAMDLPRAPAEAASFLKQKQRVAFAAGKFPDAVSAEDQLEPWLASAQQLREARIQLLDSLRAASEHGARIDPKSSGDAVVRGWLELAPLAAQAAQNPAAKAGDIQAWLARHPNHPANDVVRTQLLARRALPPVEAAPVVAGATNIALLLPLEGRQSALAASVRDGFMTAFYQTPVAQRPRVRVYDTSEGSAGEAINRAVQEGATFIVGPLTREEVIAAAELSSQHPPILALNFLPAEHVVPPDFYQFALSPEDEARLAAHRILDDGHHLGAALVPSGDWGSRVLNAFKQEMQAGGGTVFATAAVDTSDTDYSDAVTQVLASRESVARHRRLEQALGSKLQFEPRRRNDLEFLFTPAEASTERLLRPQLRFHYAGSVPTYATSAAFEPDPRANQDLEGLIFPDMPWMLGGDLAEAVRSAARDAWPTGRWRSGSGARLYAFGFDAYRLTLALRNGGMVQIDGLTGRLTVDSGRRIHRDLQWVQVHNGEVRLLPTPATSASAQ
jgi:outer membrane PBP1 activator LpoA protein